MCVEFYRWSIELQGNVNPTFSSLLGLTLLFIEKATIDPLYLWVIKGFTLEGLHDRGSIGGGERGITLGNPKPTSYATEVLSGVR